MSRFQKVITKGRTLSRGIAYLFSVMHICMFDENGLRDNSKMIITGFEANGLMID